MADCSEILAERLSLTANQNLLLGIVAVIIACLTVIVNSVLASALWKAKQLKTSTDILICLLSLSDCVQGTVTMPLTSVIFLTHSNQRKCRLFIPYTLCSTLNTHFSGCLLFLISLDKYISVRPNLKEVNGCLRKLKARFVLIILVALCFIWSATASGSVVTENELNIELPVICVFIVDVCALSTVFVLYIKMYVTVWHHTQTSVVYKRKGRMNTDRPRHAKELAKTILSILITVAICYLPVTVLHAYVWGIAKGTVSNSVQFSLLLFCQLANINSVFNACIILYGNRHLREYVRKNMFCCLRISVSQEDPQDSYSLSPGVWQSFVTIRSCNHLMRIISTYVDNTKKSEIS